MHTPQAKNVDISSVHIVGLPMILLVNTSKQVKNMRETRVHERILPVFSIKVSIPLTINLIKFTRKPPQ